MSARFDGPSILVTGGNNGPGFTAAKYLANEGAQVFIAAHRVEELEKARDEIGPQVVPVPCDTTHPADLDHLFTAIGEHAEHLDGVLANAGRASYSNIDSYTEDDVDAIVGLNPKATVFTVQGALPLMRDGALNSPDELHRGLARLDGSGDLRRHESGPQSFARRRSSGSPNTTTSSSTTMT